MQSRVEGDRRKAIKTDPKALASGDYWQQKRMFDYIEAFSQQGALKENIQKRHSVYREWFLAHLGFKSIELTIKDPKRSFDQTDREVIWYLAGGVCAKCGNQIAIEEMHADHIVPHARGGKTILSNAQCLCADCNRRKSAQI